MAGLGVLMAGATLLSGPAGCAQASALVPPGEPGRATYLDLSVVAARLSAACSNAARIAASGDIMSPFAAEANLRRAGRAESDPTYSQRTDPELNQGRVNFLLFGYGETYEPPYGPDFKGSINLFSVDLSTLGITTITLNHDIRAPEVERYRQRTDHRQGPTRLDQAYAIGGFDLMRQIVEDATGLSVDYQLAISDSVIKDAVDDLFGGLNVDVPFDFDAMPIYYEGARYEARHYAIGSQTMSGIEALQFIKALNAGDYDPRKELAIRNQLVERAMLDAVKNQSAHPFFWTRALTFLRSRVENQAIAYDFDPIGLLLKSVQPSLVNDLQGDIQLPSLSQGLYIVDERSGDGGVEWVTGSANPIIRQELEDGIYVDRSFSVPKDGADPYAPDLIAHYWPSVRELVKQRLTSQ